MQLLQLFTQCLDMLCIGFSPNVFAHIPSPFAISTSGERNLCSRHPLHFSGGTSESLGVVGGPVAEPSPEPGWLGPGQLRAWLRCGTSQRRWPPAPCRTLPALSRPLVTSCGQCWEGRKLQGIRIGTHKPSHASRRTCFSKMCLLTWAPPAPSPAGVF